MLNTELILEHCTALIARKVAEQIRVTEKPSFEKRLFTVEEAAEYLGRSPNAVKLMVARGKLPVTKIDSKIQLDRRELDKLISDCTFVQN